MTSRKEEIRAKEVPDVIVDGKSKKKYMKGRFLGKVFDFLGSIFGMR
jgi:hypothetical protein